MFDPTPTFSQNVWRLWCLIRGPDRVANEAAPQVIVHDPAAKKAHDLDDPFFDATVQSRIGDAIGNASHKSAR